MYYWMKKQLQHNTFFFKKNRLIGKKHTLEVIWQTIVLSMLTKIAS